MRARVGDQVLGLLRKLGGAEEDVRGDVQEGGPRARAERRADGLTDGAVDLFRRLHGLRELGEAAHHRQVVQLLQ